jgi:hypothetical protein
MMAHTQVGKWPTKNPTERTAIIRAAHQLRESGRLLMKLRYNATNEERTELAAYVRNQFQTAIDIEKIYGVDSLMDPETSEMEKALMKGQ